GARARRRALIRFGRTLLLRLRLLPRQRHLGGDDRAAAIRRAAQALVELLVGLGRLGRALVVVVVRELLALPDRPVGLDVDATILDHRIAVRIARVIDEPRLD